MDSKIVSRIIVLLIIGFSLTSCSSQKENSFREELPPGITDLNKQVKITVPEITVLSNDGKSSKVVGKDDLHIGDAIDLQVDNLTNDLLEFSYENGLRIYSYDTKSRKWNNISNSPVIYLPENPTNWSLHPKGQKDSLGFTMIDFKPVLYPSQSPVEIRVLLVGNIIRDGKATGQQVAGFIDLRLKP